MTFKIKILGAASIGNHLAHVARTRGWSVDPCDIDQHALERTRTQIYPMRYGVWDENIRLFATDHAPKGGYNLVFIGTSPDVHIPLALQALTEKLRAILIEKSGCGPDLEGAEELYPVPSGTELLFSLGMGMWSEELRDLQWSLQRDSANA